MGIYTVSGSYITLSGRKQNMKDFVIENDLVTPHTQKTNTSPKGTMVSTLDYVFYPKRSENTGDRMSLIIFRCAVL